MFFAIIMVVLITFLFTIFDYSRLQFIQLEASSNFETAAELSLSQYEPLLFHQYGIFAGNQGLEVETVFNEALETQFYPDKAKNKTYLLDYVLEEPSSLPKLSMMEPEGYEFELSYEPLISNGYNQPKEQILKFMKLREPYLVLKPFLTNLDILSKSSRSSSIIEEKNKMLAAFTTIEDYKLKLFKLIDGVEIYSDGSWSLLDQSTYVRKFTYSEDLNYNYFPINAQYRLEKPVFNYSDYVDDLVGALNQVEVELEGLLDKDPYTYIYTNEVSEEGSEIEPILIGVVEHEATKQTFSKLGIISENLGKLESIVTIINEQIDVNEEALILVNDLETVCLENISEIENYQKRLSTTDYIIEAIRDQINNELNDIKNEMTISEINFNQTDNLSLIKTQLSNNVENLSQSLAYTESLAYSLENYIYCRYLSLKQNASIDDEQLELLDSKISVFLADHKNTNPIDLTTVENLLAFNDMFISRYKSDVLFDYQELGVGKPDANVYEEKEDSLLDLDLVQIFKDIGLINFYPDLSINEGFLPSHQVQPALLTIVDFSKMENNVVTSEALSGFDFGAISELAGNIHDTVLINEYAIGMFSNVNKTNNPNSKTLNGYKVDEHFLDYETEYILAGHLDEQRNMDVVLSCIYGTRMMLNILHLAMEPTKRATIMKIATTIAGWWTGGVGAIIIGIVIATCWALLESAADVFMLVSGERVPILKTRSTWYTSLDGNILDLFNGGVQRMENEMIKYMEETNAFIDDGLSGLKELLIQNHDAFIDADFSLVNGYIDELRSNLVDFGEEIGLGFESFDMDFDTKLDEYINENLKATFVDGNNNYYKNPFEDDKSRIISTSVLQNIYLDYYNLPSDKRTMDELIIIKDQVMECFGYQVTKYKADYKSKVSSIYNETINYQVAMLEEGVSQMIKEGTKIGRKAIVDKADEIKGEFIDQVESDIDVNSGAEAFIPSFSYEDYLRVFLLLPIVDETTKIARIMDLIQLNTQKIYDDYNMNLIDYYIGVDVKGQVNVKTLFIPNVENHQIKQTWNLEVYHVHKNY